jgi:TP901 family phage tail tape measure protein
MSSYAFNYSFNITGNCSAAVSEIAENVDALNRKIKDSTGFFDTFQSTVFKVNQCSEYINNLSNSIDELMRPGADLNAQLADLAAISGAAGKELAIIEENARATAITFGGSAAQSVEAYKLLLSQLSPELTKYPAALRAMGDNIAILSKTMGGDATAAATVLTTAMNQFGVSLADPMEASEKMAEMMNIMAAAGREGSAELPTIQKALEQCGMMAKASGVSFAEANAAIQALDKAGKKGAEGGVALRNVMSILGQGRFLPKDVQQELAAAGVDINDLTDKSKSLTERMRALQPVMNDSALFTKLFGRENSAAAMALMQSLDQVDAWTEAITGTNTAVDQSQIIMETYDERLSRIRARFDDIKISIFNVCGDFGIWTQVVSQALIPVAQLIPLISGLGTAFKWLFTTNWAGVWATISGGIVRAYTSLAMYNGYLSIGQVATLGFRGSLLQASVALVRFATVGIMNGIKAVGAYVLSLVTGGTASVTFAGIASTSFAAFKTAAVTACRAVGVAIKNIPVIGWIIAAISAIAALFAYFWNTSAKFRGVVKGIGAFFVAVFKGLWDTAKEVLSKVADALGSIFKLDFKAAKNALSGIGTAFADYGKAAASAFQNAYNEEVAKSKAANTDDAAAIAGVQGIEVPEPETPEANPIANNIGGIGGGADSSDRIKNINITIDSLVGSLTIETTNMHESAERIKDMITEALLGAVNDVNLAM